MLMRWQRRQRATHSTRGTGTRQLPRTCAAQAAAAGWQAAPAALVSCQVTGLPKGRLPSSGLAALRCGLLGGLLLLLLVLEAAGEPERKGGTQGPEVAMIHAGQVGCAAPTTQPARVEAAASPPPSISQLSVVEASTAPHLVASSAFTSSSSHALSLCSVCSGTPVMRSLPLGMSSTVPLTCRAQARGAGMQFKGSRATAAARSPQLAALPAGLESNK